MKFSSYYFINDLILHKKTHTHVFIQIINVISEKRSFLEFSESNSNYKWIKENVNYISNINKKYYSVYILYAALQV